MLIEYYGTECSHCLKMKPSIERLEKEQGIKFTSKETWHNDDNEAERAKYDQGLCGGVPFFYNTENGAYVCGEVPYEELKSWAKQ